MNAARILIFCVLGALAAGCGDEPDDQHAGIIDAQGTKTEHDQKLMAEIAQVRRELKAEKSDPHMRALDEMDVQGVALQDGIAQARSDRDARARAGGRWANSIFLVVALGVPFWFSVVLYRLDRVRARWSPGDSVQRELRGNTSVFAALPRSRVFWAVFALLALPGWGLPLSVALRGHLRGDQDLVAAVLCVLPATAWALAWRKRRLFRSGWPRVAVVGYAAWLVRCVLVGREEEWLPSDFLLCAVLLPAAIAFASRWIYRGFRRREESTNAAPTRR